MRYGLLDPNLELSLFCVNLKDGWLEWKRGAQLVGHNYVACSWCRAANCVAARAAVRAVQPALVDR